MILFNANEMSPFQVVAWAIIMFAIIRYREESFVVHSLALIIRSHKVGPVFEWLFRFKPDDKLVTEMGPCIDGQTR